MITVRFPNGFSLQYNDLTYLRWNPDTSACLYESKAKYDEGKGWKVYVPGDCVIEFERPCNAYNPIVDRQADRIANVEKELRGLRRQLREAKR